MKKTGYIIGFVVFVVFGAAGIVLNKSNPSKKMLAKQKQLTNNGDTLAADKLPLADTNEFVMPKYDEQAMQEQQQERMLRQMSPEQRAEYMRQYQEYMQQMAMQEEMLKAQKEYEDRMKNPVKLSEKTQSKIDKLKAEFEQKRIQDSIARSKTIIAPDQLGE